MTAQWFAGVTCDHLYENCPARLRGEKSLRWCGWWEVGGEQHPDPSDESVCGWCRRKYRTVT